MAISTVPDDEQVCILISHFSSLQTMILNKSTILMAHSCGERVIIGIYPSRSEGNMCTPDIDNEPYCCHTRVLYLH